MIGRQLGVNAARYPDSNALVYGVRRYTYAALDERSRRLANALSEAGIQRGERVAALLHNCNQFVELIFATALIGAIFVPINFRLVAREVGQLLQACTPAILFAGHDFGPVLETLQATKSLPKRVIRVDDRPPLESSADADSEYESWLRARCADDRGLHLNGEDALMLLHSSGTTGLPKGAIFTHATAFASSVAKIIDFGLTDRDATVVFGPLFHAGPLMDLTLPLLLRGGRVVIGASRQFDAERLLQSLAEERATVAPVYPTMLRRVLGVRDTSIYDLSALRLLITGGEAVPIPVLRGIYERFPTVGLVNNYGSTEGGPITTWLSPEEKIRKMGSVGRPSFSVAVRIADEAGGELKAGEVGELLVRSPFVCRGYWNRPDLSAASLRDGWWHTGDLALRDEEGYLWISGRKKDMIKSGTESIYPIEVEQVIAALEGVVEVSVIGVPDEDWGEAVVAYVVLAPGADINAAAVINHCRQHLASYKKPRYVEFVDSLPRSGTNKVSKSALQARFAAAVQK